MKITSSQLFMAALTIYANKEYDKWGQNMTISQAIKDAEELAEDIEETSRDVIPLAEVKDVVEYIITKYKRPISKFTLSSILQGEFGYTRQEAESMVDRCEFHGFIENIGTETKTLFQLKTE